jgi:hypothetical protein
MIYKITWGGMLWNQKIMLNRSIVSKKDRLRSINGSNLNVPGEMFLKKPHWNGYRSMLPHFENGQKLFLSNALIVVSALPVIVEKNVADLLMKNGYKE